MKREPRYTLSEAKPVIFAGHNMGLVWMGAFQYWCGRKTIAVSGFIEVLIQEWSNLPENVRAFIERDLERAFAEDDAQRLSGNDYKRLGHDCDRAEWSRVRALYKEGESC